MAKYVKLGEQARSFSDAYSEFTISGKHVKELSTEQQKSIAIQRALTTGHLVQATEQEFLDWEEELEIINAGGKVPEKKTGKAKKLTDMTKDELLAFYKETYEVDDDQEADFIALNKAERLAFLQDLEKKG